MSVIKIKDRMRALYYEGRPFTALVDSQQRAYVVPPDLQDAFNAFLERNAVTNTLQPVKLDSTQIKLKKFETVPFDLSLEIGSAIEAFNCADVHLVKKFYGKASGFSTASFLAKRESNVDVLTFPTLHQ